MTLNQTLTYFNKPATVVKFNDTHVLVRLQSGALLCTNRNTFERC